LVFTTPEFVVFFIVVVPIYFLLPLRLRWYWLLASSFFFYASWNVNYLWILIFSASIDYLAALTIDRTPPEQKSRRRIYLASSLGINLGILFLFKYFNFFNQSAGTVLGAVGIPYTPLGLELLLPVGISFYTFQAMSYTIDVYRGNLKAEKNPVIYMTFVVFFPQLVAGPIERATNLIPQFHQKFRFDVDRVVSGLQLMLWGAFKKIVIADRLAIYVDTVYANPQGYSTPALMLATVFFAFQIYTDFSAYTDIAIGVARIMGFNFMQNFRQPYFSRSVREFWARWHISLSTWFRDYLYIPLGGNRVSLGRNLLNLMIVFLVSGLWHGAAWTFVIWGFIHGLFVCLETLLARRSIHLLPRALPAWVRNGLSLGFVFVVVNIAWVFFRAESLSDALYIVMHFIVPAGGESALAPFEAYQLNVPLELALSLGAIGLLLLVDYFDSRHGLTLALGRLPSLMRWGFYYATALAVVLSYAIYSNTSAQFIYFQF
jgi:alginate O-acetyltransferase complex protein AlgI